MQSDNAEKSVLVVDDDDLVSELLETALTERGLPVLRASNIPEALAHISSGTLRYAVIDLKLADGNGVDLVKCLKEQQPSARAIILSGYGDLPTAVAAVKAGAADFLTKPVDPDTLVSVLLADDGEPPLPPQKPLSADRARWEHIMRTFESCGRNVSETARRLHMHRRTLQRILMKREPR
jgi:two-component system, response regulator RegA